MGKSVPGRPEVDEEFLVEVQKIEKRYSKNLSVETYNKCIEWLQQRRDSGPQAKGSKSAITKALNGIGIPESKLSAICEDVYRLHLEYKDGAQ